MSDSNQEAVAQFLAITQSTEEKAKFFLQASNWNVETALGAFYGADGMDVDAQEEEAPQHQQQQQHSQPQQQQQPSKPWPSSSQTGRATGMHTFAAMNKNNDDSDESDDESKQKFFAGGSKTSGQLITGPPSADSARGAIDSIVNLAKKHGKQFHEEIEQEKAEKRNAARFAGTGYTLGDEEQESTVIPGAEPEAEAPSITLTFWQGGFQIDDGEFRSQDDPANAQFLADVQRGTVPVELRHRVQGSSKPLDIRIVNKHTEEFVAPKKVHKPFSGSGNMLGSPTPNVVTNTASTSTATPPASAEQPVPKMEVDESKPITSIQVRLADGTRLIVKANHDHTVGQLRDFIRLARSNTGPFKLMMAFPPKEITDEAATLKDANLLSSVVIQRNC